MQDQRSQGKIHPGTTSLRRQILTIDFNESMHTCISTLVDRIIKLAMGCNIY